LPYLSNHDNQSEKNENNQANEGKTFPVHIFPSLPSRG
jgi:hypothetical protein